MFFSKTEKYESKSQTMDELMEVDPNSLQNRVVNDLR
jgi:hypothetical protein